VKRRQLFGAVASLGLAPAPIAPALGIVSTPYPSGRLRYEISVVGAGQLQRVICGLDRRWSEHRDRVGTHCAATVLPKEEG
jgi:hypothetical protein